MLKVSDAVNLAFHASALLAGAEGPRSVGDLARRMEMSENHLSKVMQRLGRAGLVKSRRGPSGGFELARPAQDIRLLDIYEAIEGPYVEQGCLLAKPVCDGSCCLLGGLLQSVHAQLRSHLESTRLADMCPAFQIKREKEASHGQAKDHPDR